MKTYKTIYLQIEPLSLNNQTWCEDKINDSDVEYILKSKYDELEKQNEELIKRLNKLYDVFCLNKAELKIELEKIKQKPIEEILKEVE